VYAEDPARKFLPSIGFLKKYKEPNVNDPNRRVRIDTGVEEGSEISMYYDPMISKLITWGKDREESMRILDQAFDEYVIQGVTHNIEFGKSILANDEYWTGNYSTAFIPNNYPDGYQGDPLLDNDLTQLAIAAHQVKNIYMAYGKVNAQSPLSSELYVTISASSSESDPVDFKVV
jgi:propionyl-CoA carboxylase alpha chain